MIDRWSIKQQMDIRTTDIKEKTADHFVTQKQNSHLPQKNQQIHISTKQSINIIKQTTNAALEIIC